MESEEGVFSSLMLESAGIGLRYSGQSFLLYVVLFIAASALVAIF